MNCDRLSTDNDDGDDDENDDDDDENDDDDDEGSVDAGARMTRKRKGKITKGENTKELLNEE